MDKQELLAEMQAGRGKLEGVLAGLSEPQMLEPALFGTWSIKDWLGHLEYWERRVAEIYLALRDGRQVPLSGYATVDELNNSVYAANRDRPLAEVRRDEENAYSSLRVMVENAPEADMSDPQRFAWTNGQPFGEWIAGNSYGHYEEHWPDLVAWLNKPS